MPPRRPKAALLDTRAKDADSADDIFNFSGSLRGTPSKASGSTCPSRSPGHPGSPSATADTVEEALQRQLARGTDKKKSHKDDAVRACSIDGLPCKPGKRYCIEHNKAHDNIRRAAERLGKKNPDDPQWKAYREIFGSRSDPCDPALADEIVMKYTDEIQGEVQGQKSGNKREAPPISPNTSTAAESRGPGSTSRAG